MPKRSSALVLGTATVGGILLYAGLSGAGVSEVFAGTASMKGRNPKGGKEPFDLTAASGPDAGGAGGSATGLGGQLSGLTGTPKDIIDKYVCPLASKHHMATGTTPGMVSAANARHGSTVSGGRSDHQGPPSKAWAADMSNGPSPTKEMDALARDLATMFGIPWHGKGLVSKTHGKYRYQLIYRTMSGGNHFNHVHFGVRRI